MHYNILRPDCSGCNTIDEATLTTIQSQLAQDGWTLLRGYDVDMTKFSALSAKLCAKITFDPARDQSEKNTQKVDAGLGPIGLHIENGNTPVCPDIVAFYSPRAAFEGSQTTICDGRSVLARFDAKRRARWSRPITVKRNLPEALWKRYLANEHPAISRPEEVTERHILEFKAAVPNQDFALRDDGSLDYSLTINPVRASTLSGGLVLPTPCLAPRIITSRPAMSLTMAKRSAPVRSKSCAMWPKAVPMRSTGRMAMLPFLTTRGSCMAVARLSTPTVSCLSGWGIFNRTQARPAIDLF